jgi:hypothetical protein
MSTLLIPDSATIAREVIASAVSGAALMKVVKKGEPK